MPELEEAMKALGFKLVFTNSYVCERCMNEWVETWSRACDSECQDCGARNISPYDWEEEWVHESG